MVNAPPSSNGARPANASGDLSIFGALFRELGSSRWGISQWGEAARAGEPPELQGDKAVKAFREMRLNDPIVGAVVMATKMIIRGVEWKAELAEDAEGDDAQAEKGRAFLHSAMNDMSQPWEEVVDDSLEAVYHGFEPMEVVYKQRLGPNPPPGAPGEDPAGSEHDDGLIGWRKVAHRDPLGLVRWDIDEHGGIRGFWHRAEGQTQDEVYIPISKTILFRASRLGNDPQGLSWLRTGHRAYRFKRNLEWIEAVTFERGGAGYPVVEMPRGANTASGSTDHTRAQALVENVRMDAYMGVVLPPPLGSDENARWRFHFEDTGGGSLAAAIDSSIRRYASEIAASVLAYFIILTMNNRGAYALSRDQRDLWHLAMSGLVDTWAQLINRFLVRPLFELNQSAFPDRERWPRIVPGDISQHDIEKVQGFITAMTGVNILDVSDDDRNRVRAMIGWPPETREQVEAREEREAEMEQMRAQAAASPSGGDEREPGAEEVRRPPPPPPTRAAEWSAAERAVGKPVHEWGTEDAWLAAMALEDGA